MRLEKTAWLLLLIGLVFLCSCASDDDDAGGGDDEDDDDSLDDDDNDSTGDDDDDDNDTTSEWITIDAGQMTVMIHKDPYQMRILDPDEQVLLETPLPTKALNLSPTPFLPHAFQTVRIKGDWWYAKEVIDWSKSGNVTELTVRAVGLSQDMPDATLTLIFEPLEDNHLLFTASATGPQEIHYHTGAYVLDDDEHFFGLGLQYDSNDSRGKLRNMFLGLGVDLTDQVQNHAPMPFYISSRGYGLFTEEKGKGYFDMGRSSKEAFGYKFATDNLKTHIFWGPNPLDIIDSYTAITGRPPLNPDYLFGHLHWRNNNHNEAEMYSDMDQLRARGIPTSSIMIDAPWQTNYSTFEFAQCPSGCLFEDAQAVIDYAHQKGFAFYVWTAEFVNRWTDEEVPGMIEDNSAQFDLAKDAGFLMPIFGFLYEIPWWHQEGAIVNFLNPDAYAWYQDQARSVMEMGIQGFKMDGGEYPGADTIGLWTLGAFDLGGFGDPNTSQYEFKWAYHHLFWELAQEYNGNLGLSSVRCAVWGEQTHINYFWPGDLDSSWGTDLGLPADVVGGLTLGTAGFPYYGSNNGGFSGYGTDDELLYARWTTHSAFRPIFESSRKGTQDVWEDYPGWFEAFYRKYAVIHTRLFPYMKAYADQATRAGHPIMRMLPLMYMDDAVTYTRDFDYMLGDWLLVEPVVEQGAYTREVYLPDDRWVDYWTNEVLDGPKTMTVDVAIDEIPVYVRAGAIVPMLDASVQTLWPTDDPDVIDHTDVDDILWLDLYPYGSTSFALADGSAFTLDQSKGGFAFEVVSGPLARNFSLRAVPAIYGGGKPTSVTGPSGALPVLATWELWDESARGWFYDDAGGDLWIRDGCTTGAFTVTQ